MYKYKNCYLRRKIYYLGEYAFNCCKSLKSIKLPTALCSIEEGLLNAAKISELKIGKNVTEINCDIFTSLKYLKKITASKNNQAFSCKDGILYDKQKTKLLACPQKFNKTKLIVPSTVKIIEQNAFYKNKKIKQIVLPNKLEQIGTSAFSGTQITELNIPKSIKTIWEYAIEYCPKLKKINIKGNSEFVLENLSVRSCPKLEKITVKSSERIGKDAISNCQGLKTVSIKTIILDRYAISNCEKLKTVTVKGAKKLGKKSLGYYYNDKKEKCVKIKGFTIKGKKNSAAHKYAKENGFKFAAI